MSWPVIKIIGTCVCEDDGEFEGRALSFRWGSLLVEITVARWEPRHG